jgi:AraC-like DNA-binding protein
MRVSAIFAAAVHCCNTANSSLTIDGKFEIMNIEFRYKKPSKLLDDFVHIYWEHKNTSNYANILTIFPDSFFKLIFLYQKGKIVAYFMTGLWTDEMEFKTPPNTTIYGVKFKILAPEYIFQNEVATILQSHKDLPTNFLNLRELDFCNFESFVEHIEPLLLKRVNQIKKRIKAHKLQLSQLLYMVNGNVLVDEVSKQINWSSRQINRYLNKYLGVSLTQLENTDLQTMGN